MEKPTREAIRDLYAVSGDQYEGPRLHDPKGRLLSEYDVRLFREMLPALPDSARVLEVGAGTGRFTQAMMQLPYRVTATDINDSLLASLAEKVERAGCADRVSVRNEDAFQLSFEGGQFDLVYSLHMIPRFMTWEDERAALLEMFRVLKPGGRLLFNYRNGRSLYGLFHRGFAGDSRRVRALLQEHGMRVVRKRGKWLLTRRTLNMLPLAGGRLLAGLDRLLLGVLPDFAWDVFVLAVKD